MKVNMFIMKFLQPPPRRVRCSVVARALPPGYTWSAPAACCPGVPVNLALGVRTLSNMRTFSAIRTPLCPKTLSGSRVFLKDGSLLGLSVVSRAQSMSGNSTSAGSGWYNSLAESGPVHLCEQYLMGVQQVTGFPWWLSIIMSTVMVRTLITLPLATYQVVIIAKVEALQAEISELAKRLRYEVSFQGKERGWTEREKRFQFQKHLRHLVSQLYIRDNCHPFKASLLVWVQLPLWISLSLALRNLSLNQPGQCGLTTGGALWFPDLTSPDSTWILPLCLGLTNLLIVEVFSLQKLNQSRFQRLTTNFIRVFSVLMIPVAASVPSSMALYWFSSSLVGFCHNLVLRSPTAHKLLKLQAQRSDTPYRDLLTAFVNKYCK
ncbi:cytochrome c oxidase assembly protein COX18, mitochondrial isoform X2 [Takifugu rubripes]|uniref:cytochrome c oxidase assembly protein COX18, mitochondrial isoform X2 n=2 Tax=Takifugu rubripes TaxID=31033 RepID=UPI00114541B7|nr:cytochrome c oxidase assembly protein COX18, mitochondrial isoform X2 [Takifugu rubripes]XP_056899643.1 cytochrome c oxidase assembly protein COX18, mitochondrial isoform X2 [Takifugu flavidus]